MARETKKKKKHTTLNDLNLNNLFYWINFGLKVEHKISIELETKFEGTNYTWISAQVELHFENKHFFVKNEYLKLKLYSFSNYF